MLRAPVSMRSLCAHPPPLPTSRLQPVLNRCGLTSGWVSGHEELTDGHEMKWAKRMVCGFCSLEQTIAEKCSGCGKRLATTAANPEGRKTRFWEGGQGCRDRRLLDARDKHKYKNSNAKTISKKAQARKAGT